MDYEQWAKQYASTINSWGLIESIAQGWIEDLLREKQDADITACWASLKKIRGAK